jgi:16S rRNA (uracil1498-N3)-methyltransferase
MTTHRFFVSTILNSSQLTVTEPGLLNQWLKVLRFGVGEKFNIIDIEGKEAIVKIIALDKRKVELEVQTILPAKIIDQTVHLVVAILKKENFELVVQKATEIGVATIQPIITERTVKLGLNEGRLEKIITEASEQSGRQWKPVLRESLTLADYLGNDYDYPQISFSLNQEAKTTLGLNKSRELAILVGPEGGWGDGEEKVMKEKGIKFKSLGPQILRAETAAIVGSFLAVNNLI